MSEAFANLSFERSQWNPERIPPDVLELFYPTTDTSKAQFKLPGVEQYKSERARKYLMCRHNLPDTDVLYAIDQECRHISTKVQKLRVTKRGEVAPCLTMSDGTTKHVFWKPYGQKVGTRFRYDDWMLYKLASRGSDVDHLDTIDFFVNRFGKYRFEQGFPFPKGVTRTMMKRLQNREQDISDVQHDDSAPGKLGWLAQENNLDALLKTERKRVHDRHEALFESGKITGEEFVWVLRANTHDAQIARWKDLSVWGREKWIVELRFRDFDDDVADLAKENDIGTLYTGDIELEEIEDEREERAESAEELPPTGPKSAGKRSGSGTHPFHPEEELIARLRSRDITWAEFERAEEYWEGQRRREEERRKKAEETRKKDEERHLKRRMAAIVEHYMRQMEEEDNEDQAGPSLPIRERKR